MRVNIERIKKRLDTFAMEREWEKHHTPKNLLMALTGEVGELMEIFQWLNDEEIQNLSFDQKQYAKEEVADVAIYLLRLCMKLDIDLEEAIFMKMEMNEKKYPTDKFRGDKKQFLKTK